MSFLADDSWHLLSMLILPTSFSFGLSWCERRLRIIFGSSLHLWKPFRFVHSNINICKLLHVAGQDTGMDVFLEENQVRA